MEPLSKNIFYVLIFLGKEGQWLDWTSKILFPLPLHLLKVIEQQNDHPKKVQNYKNWCSLLSAWAQTVLGKINMKLYVPGDLVPLETSALVCSFLCLQKSWKTMRPYSLASVAVQSQYFLPNSFHFLSPLIFPMWKRSNLKEKYILKRVTTEWRWKALVILRWVLAAITCTVMIMLVFHDATRSLCDRCDCVFCFDTLE